MLYILYIFSLWYLCLQAKHFVTFTRIFGAMYTLNFYYEVGIILADGNMLPWLLFWQITKFLSIVVCLYTLGHVTSGLLKSRILGNLTSSFPRVLYLGNATSNIRDWVQLRFLLSICSIRSYINKLRYLGAMYVAQWTLQSRWRSGFASAYEFYRFFVLRSLIFFLRDCRNNSNSPFPKYGQISICRVGLYVDTVYQMTRYGHSLVLPQYIVILI